MQQSVSNAISRTTRAIADTLKSGVYHTPQQLFSKTNTTMSENLTNGATGADLSQDASLSQANEQDNQTSAENNNETNTAKEDTDTVLDSKTTDEQPQSEPAPVAETPARQQDTSGPVDGPIDSGTTADAAAADAKGAGADETEAGDTEGEKEVEENTVPLDGRPWLADQTAPEPAEKEGEPEGDTEGRPWLNK